MSYIEQLLNSRIRMEKHLEIKKDVYHNCIDYTKTFDRVWHKGLWRCMANFSILQEIINIIESLYYNSNSTIIRNP